MKLVKSQITSTPPEKWRAGKLQINCAAGGTEIQSASGGSNVLNIA
jgi:hypothetical protein